MTTLKKTSIVEWATQEVGVACDMVSQCLTKYNNLSPYDNGLQLLEVLEDEEN